MNTEISPSKRTVQVVLSYGIKGIYGTLGQMYKVDDQYTKAMEYLLLPKKDYVLVDTSEAANKAIELLKESNAGRATFLPLNLLTKAPENLLKPDDDCFIDYAINLITVDKMYKDAFYYALGETLIVKDLANARKYIKTYRMATLAGDIIEKSSSITGGG